MHGSYQKMSFSYHLTLNTPNSSHTSWRRREVKGAIHDCDGAGGDIHVHFETTRTKPAHPVGMLRRRSRCFMCRFSEDNVCRQ